MPPKGGRRCVVGGCSNTPFLGYAVYTVQKMKDEKVKNKWFKFIESTRRNFNKNAETCYVCDGHFEEECFNASQKAQFMSGHRKYLPELTSSAFPTLKASTEPHFKKPESYDTRDDALAIDWRNTKLEDKEPIVYIPPIMSSVVKTAKEDSTQVVLLKRPNNNSAKNHEPKKKQKRRSSMLTLEKERLAMEAAIIASVPKHTEEDCQVPDCSNPHVMATQTEPNFRHQQTQSDKRLSEPKSIPTKHKKVQFKYKGISKATQTPQQQPAQEPDRKCMCACTCQLGQSDEAPAYNYEHQNKKVSASADVQNIEEEDISDMSDDEEDPSKDPDWEMPPEEEDSDSDQEDQYLPEEESAENQPKYIVFEDNLMELLKLCPGRNCGAPCNITKVQSQTHGSLLVVKQECTLCDFQRVWKSQPYIGNVPAGNAILSSAILFAGASPTKVLRVLRHMKVKAISQDTFLNHQKLYLQVAVVRAFKQKQLEIIEELKRRGQPLILGGDGRCDSPGHSAKYGTYTFMDLTCGKVVDIQLVQTNEVQNSNQMELEGLKRSIAFLLDQGLTIGTIITDRHPSITKWLRDNHPKVTHQFDVWHIAKSVKKQLTAISKLKDCDEASLWQKSIVNHLYWSASSTPSGDGQLMAAKFHSLQNHLINKHSGHGEHDDFDQCQHGDLSGEPRRWMNEDSKVYDKITEVICKPHLTRALKQMSPLEQTSNVEAFHGVMCMWAPKLLAYSYTGMKCRSYLAVLHWNENGSRDQAVNADGSLRYKISYPKQKAGGYTVRKVLTGITYGYVDILMASFVTLMKNGDKDARHTQPELQPVEPMCSRFEHPDKEEAIQEHLERGRFATARNDEGTPV